MRQAFSARLEEVPRVVAYASAQAASAGLTPERTARLELAVEEWAVNVCRHAYQGAGGSVTVAVGAIGPALVVELTDEGPPFDPTAAATPDVTLPLAERRPGGLGVFLIQRLVDQVRYQREDSRNVLTLTLAI